MSFSFLRLSEEEVSLDEMLSGNSAYLKEDYLKRHFMAKWIELCNLLKISPNIEVVHEDGMGDGYSETPYPEINRRVQRLLRTNEFPDYVDISELVERCNTKHNLGIGATEKTELSRKIFKKVGSILKSRREKDYKAHFGSHLTDAVNESDDPASTDEVLQERLKESFKQGQEKLFELCEDFIVKQEQEGEKAGSSPDSKEEEEGEEEEEEGSIEREELIKDEELCGEDEVSSPAQEEEEEKGLMEEDSEDEETGPPAKKIKLGYQQDLKFNVSSTRSSSSSSSSSSKHSLSPVAESEQDSSTDGNAIGSGSSSSTVDVEALPDDEQTQPDSSTSIPVIYISDSDSSDVIDLCDESS